jgi:hypothetical protein
MNSQSPLILIKKKCTEVVDDEIPRKHKGKVASGFVVDSSTVAKTFSLMYYSLMEAHNIVRFKILPIRFGVGKTRHFVGSRAVNTKISGQ